MNYILIVGTAHSGKSTTINEVCRRLPKTSISQITPAPNGFNTEPFPLNEPFQDGSFLLTVNGKNVLVVVGAPTEQEIPIKLFIDFFQHQITLAVIAKRLFERRKGFNTVQELNNSGWHNILEERIIRINNNDYKNSTTWETRINKIVQTILTNLA